MDPFQILKNAGIKGWPAIALVASGIVALNYFASSKDLSDSKESIRKRENLTLIQTVEAFRMSEDRLRELEIKLKVKRRHQASLYDELHMLQVQYADTNNPIVAETKMASVDRTIASPMSPTFADASNGYKGQGRVISSATMSKNVCEDLNGKQAESDLSTVYLLMVLGFALLCFGMAYQWVRMRKLNVALCLLQNEQNVRVSAWDLIHRDHVIRKVG